MINFLGYLSLFSFIIIPVAIIWIIVNLVIKHKQKAPLITLLVGIVLLITGISLTYLPIGNTKLELDSTHINTDSDGLATLTGKASPNSTVEISSDNSPFDDYIKANKSGKFEEYFDLNGGRKKHVYSVSVLTKNNVNGPSKKVTITNATYKRVQKAKEESIEKENRESTSKSQKNKFGFEKSVKELARNTGKNFFNETLKVKFNDEDSEVTFYIPDDSTALSKEDKNKIATYLFNRTDKLAAISDVESPTTKFIQTYDYNTIARTTITGGIKVY